MLILPWLDLFLCGLVHYLIWINPHFTWLVHDKETLLLNWLNMYMTTYSWHYLPVPCLTWLPPHPKVTLFTFVWTVSLLDLILRWKLIYDQLYSIFAWFGLILAVLDFILAWLYWILFKWILALFVPGFNRLILVWRHCYDLRCFWIIPLLSWLVPDLTCFQLYFTLSFLLYTFFCLIWLDHHLVCSLIAWCECA